MRRQIGFALALFLFVVPAAFAQQDSDTEARDTTREKLRALLKTVGKRSDVEVSFHQSDKQPYNFTGNMLTGLSNSDSLEIVLRVTENDTINVRVYPHYKDAYINLDKVKEKSKFMRKLLEYNDSNFLFWGADDSADVFCGYTFTLESGFPDEAITIVIRSIRNSDGFVGELRPMIDGSAAAPKKKPST